MLDKKARFIFNVANNPAPRGTVTEDGVTRKGSQDRKGTNTASSLEEFSKAMTSGIGMLASSFSSGGNTDSKRPADDIDKEARVLEHISSIQDSLLALDASRGYLQPRKLEGRKFLKSCLTDISVIWRRAYDGYDVRDDLK